MAQMSELESALDTLVSCFHGASANRRPPLTKAEFTSFLSRELPNLERDHRNTNCILRRMGVGEGQDIRFEHFWVEVAHLASNVPRVQSADESSCLIL